MASNRTSALVLWVVIGVIGSVVGARPVAAVGTPFFDDFSDMNISDDSPATWNRASGSGTNLDASSGDLVLTAPLDASAWASLFSKPQTVKFEDVSIRTQVRLLRGEPGGGPGTEVGVFARSQGPGLAYTAGISSDGMIFITDFGVGGSGFLVSTVTALDVFSTDIHLQFDVFGDMLALTAWADGTLRPAMPQLTATDTGVTGLGWLGVFGQTGFPSTTVFRSFEAVPEPSTGLLMALGLVGLAARKEMRSRLQQ